MNKTVIFGTAAILGVSTLMHVSTAANLAKIDIHYERGLDAEFEADYHTARAEFEAAMSVAKAEEVPDAYISAITFNLGRMMGYTCDFDLAEDYLKEALALERYLDHRSQPNMTKRLSELARLSYDMGKFAESAAYYEDAILVLEELGISKVDPIGYANYLSDYAAVLDQIERLEDSSSIRDKSERLIRKNPKREAEFTPISYSTVCNGEDAR